MEAKTPELGGAIRLFYLEGDRLEEGSGGCRLTFCCLHSLQAFLLPPRRFPVIGGIFSISQGSEFLADRSKPVTGRGILGLFRRSLGVPEGVKRLACVASPCGAMTPRNSRSISINQTSPAGMEPRGPLTHAKRRGKRSRNQRLCAGNRKKSLGVEVSRNSAVADGLTHQWPEALLRNVPTKQ